MSRDASGENVTQQIEHIDKTYTALHDLIASCEKGAVAELSNKLKQFERSLADIQKIRASLSDLRETREAQKRKIADLRRQIALKDELIDSFARTDIIGDAHAEKCEQKSEERRNEENVTCPHCKSIILRGGDGIWLDGNEMEIPLARQKKSGDMKEAEKLQGWWTVKDMFTFENVGFTNSVDGIRYLTCADCDFGPIGRIIEGGLHIVAPSRVSMQ